MIKLIIYLFICSNALYILEYQRIYYFLYISLPRDDISFIDRSAKLITISYKI